MIKCRQYKKGMGWRITEVNFRIDTTAGSDQIKEGEDLPGTKKE